MNKLRSFHLKKYYLPLFIGAFLFYLFQPITQAQAQAEAMNSTQGLFKLAGIWEGKGTALISSAPEDIKCRATARPQGQKLQVAISCYSSIGEHRIVSYLGIEDKSKEMNGILYQRIEGKQGEMRARLSGVGDNPKLIRLLLYAVGDNRASVILERVGKHRLTLKIFDFALQDYSFEVDFKRTALFK